MDKDKKVTRETISYFRQGKAEYKDPFIYRMAKASEKFMEIKDRDP